MFQNVAYRPTVYRTRSSTLRFLLNELAGLRIVTILKRASSFNRDLRVGRQLVIQGLLIEQELYSATYSVKIWSGGGRMSP